LLINLEFMDTEELTTSPGFVPLTSEQLRVLGCMLEKEVTTPDAYPLTLNQLVLACNQSTNRDPVVAYTDGEVQDAVDGLKARQFAFQVTLAGSRVQKFKHNVQGKLPRLERPEIAIMALLLLRGAQTIGEIRQRCERLYAFPDLATAEGTLKELMGDDHGDPLVVCFPPGPGRKSALYVHTLGVLSDNPTQSAKTEVTASFAPTNGVKEDDLLWRARIEAEIAKLRGELAELKAKLGE
jgi:uncharacterized protein